MDFGSSFSFVFKDPDWVKKLLIMGLVTLIPVLGQLVLMGWMAEVLRRTARATWNRACPTWTSASSWATALSSSWWPWSIPSPS